jgi:hypothetical protein
MIMLLFIPLLIAIIMAVLSDSGDDRPPSLWRR